MKFNTTRQLDRLTPFDYQLFELGKTNANYITDYYMRSPTSGTRWFRQPTPPDPEKEETWRVLYAAWQDEGNPEPVWVYQDISFTIQKDDDGYPVFWHQHGWLFLPWQLEAHHTPQPEITIVGGYGSAKTALIAMSLAVMAMTVPHFRGYSVAPQMLQAQEVYRYLMTHCANTPWMNRFVWHSPTKPYPKFVLRGDYIGESTIEVLSIEKDPEKVRTLEGDVIYFDQAEKIEDLDELVRDLGSRLRGQVHGRQRLGRLALVANAGDNPQLWMRYDMAELEPETYRSFNPSTYDNIYLTKTDIANLKRRVSASGDPHELEQWLNGKRPIGKGKHFPGYMVQDCLDPGLDRIMDQAQQALNTARQENELALQRGLPEPVALESMPEYAFIKKTSPRVGVYHWELPPDHKAKRQYLVIADPGQADPPDRNSAVIGVWDITEFPKGPAVMRAFHWVYCRGSYWPFINEYERMVRYYKAQARNGFDATGTQKGFDELVFATQGLHAEGINLSGNGKYLALNALKFLMGKRLIRFPYITRLVNQLTNYDLPDTRIPQDLVMMLAMTAMYLRRYYYEEVGDDEQAMGIPLHENRYERSIVDRYARPRR